MGKKPNHDDDDRIKLNQIKLNWKERKKEIESLLNIRLIWENWQPNKNVNWVIFNQWTNQINWFSINDHQWQ